MSRPIGRNRLAVVEHLPQCMVLCRCECGVSKVVTRFNLARMKSCGCGRVTHNKTNTPEYKAWQSMKARCTYKKHPAYASYGGRGISVCDRWSNSFENFFADMGKKPGPRYSVERKDNELGYSPENCVWATAREQAENRKTSRALSFNGKTQGISAWAREVGIGRSTLNERLRRGWPLEGALGLPPVANRGQK